MLGSDEHGVWRPMTGTVWTAGIAYDPVLDRTWAVDLRGQAVHVLDRTMAEVGHWSLADAGAPGAYQSITDIAYAGSDRLMLVSRSRGRVETRSPVVTYLSAWIAGCTSTSEFSHATLSPRLKGSNAGSNTPSSTAVEAVTGLDRRAARAVKDHTLQSFRLSAVESARSGPSSHLRDRRPELYGL